MAINNPYIPGDPYSYDLKWIVAEIKRHSEQLATLDEQIAAAIIKFLDQHDPVYYSTAADLIASDLKPGALAYIEGFNDAGDGGACLYFVTDDYNAIIGQPFYLTLAGANRWALPIILTPFVTPEMFGAKADGTEDDTAAIQLALDNGLPVLLMKGKTYRAENLIAPEKTVLNGNGATIQSVTTNNTILTINRDSKLIDVSLSGIDFDNLAACGLKFSAAAYRIDIQQLALAYCAIGVDDTAGIWSVNIGKIFMKHCEKGFQVIRSASTSLSIQNFLHENCGQPLYLKNVNYSTINVLAGDYANGGEESTWPYPKGYGSRANSVYMFEGCKAFVVNSIAGENNIGRYFATIGYSDIDIQGAYIVKQTSYEATNRALFFISPEISHVKIGATTIYPDPSIPETQYDYVCDFNYNIGTYGLPTQNLLQLDIGSCTPRTPKLIYTKNETLEVSAGYYEINTKLEGISSATYFDIVYTKNPNRNEPVYQEITLILSNNTGSYIVKGDVKALLMTNATMPGLYVFDSYQASNPTTPTSLTATLTTTNPTATLRVTLPTGSTVGRVIMKNYYNDLVYDYSFT